jgi:hypothetical protein
VPFLRLTRDSRGYENTFLLHVAHPGEHPRVLYWYRSAPGVRVGRPPLDEDAIRTIEDRHPDIEFDWPHILEVGATIAPEVERRPERPRRRPRAEENAPVTAGESEAGALEGTAYPTIESAQDPAAAPVETRPARPQSTLLDELVGREIAARLRERFAEIAARVAAVPDPSARAAWHVRADPLDPDSWVTPEAVLRGVEQADRMFDELRRELE